MATRRKKKETSTGLRSFLTQTLQGVVALAVVSLPGLVINGFLLLAPVFGASYLAYRKRRLRKIGVNQPPSSVGLLVRATVAGTFFTAAFIAPIRGSSYILARLTGVEKLQELLLATSFNGVIDAWIGVCGVSMAIIAGLIYWRQAVRLKSQIVNLPTAKVRSAAMGMAEFKGVVRTIPDADQRLTKRLINDEEKEFTRQDAGEDSAEPIIYYREVKSTNKPSTEIILSRFYLEDETGKILVDPRSADSWDGKDHFFTHPTRHFFLQEDEQDRLMRVPGTDYYEKTDNSELRRLLPGDEAYLLGNVEENSAADPNALGVDRLIVRPASTLHDTNPINRIMFGEKRASGSDIYSLFFLTDVQEQEARKMLTRGMGTVWIWVAVWVGLSLQPLLANSATFFDGQSVVAGLREFLWFFP
jgi:hypothetical protein